MALVVSIKQHMNGCTYPLATKSIYIRNFANKAVATL